ncbi:NADP-dependent oxidoreductase domain-containing protein [Zychaea mexicana]|uniref:NADP-dependent oxidoreductase domain-containing protein n=1 Tax=Zychaea mexicana TaxID=64656 RepID=UPI0022FEAE2E|nr:NADP-dependent oxidoreductase domain-containing protein [Zychaea mexicana]KAI9492369.1 NADP-dependent oxidoreductase domain-containing protein [Zychaea mexicana]
MTIDNRTVKLNSGYSLPLVGYGTFGGPDAPEQVYAGSKLALEAGYRHFDTAYLYRTEEALGKAIRESSVPREEIFVTTKLWQTFHEPQHVRPACERSLELLGLDYIDLYMLHWPMAWKFVSYEFDDLKKPDENGDISRIDVPIIETWRAMEELVKAGLVRSIGISNFTMPMLEELLKQCEIEPAVHQLEIHPSLPQEEMLKFCNKYNIVLTAYSPLANPGYSGMPSMLSDPIVLRVAEKYGKTPVQVLLNWGVARGYAVIPKSVTPERIKANFEHFNMDKEDIEAILDIGRTNQYRSCSPLRDFGPSNNIFDEPVDLYKK